MVFHPVKISSSKLRTAQDSPSRKLDQYIVRFPDGLRGRLKTHAHNHNRSMNAEIVERLQVSFLNLGIDAPQLDRIEAAVTKLAALTDLHEALMMVRDADEDNRKDGNPTIPPMARAKIDRALAKAEGKL